MTEAVELNTQTWQVSIAADVVVISPDGQDRTPRARKARALVAYLASKPDLAASRVEIADLLWSNRAREQARASLRQCLSELRHEADGLIQADAEGIALSAGVSLTQTGNLRDLSDIDPAFAAWIACLREWTADPVPRQAFRANPPGSRTSAAGVVNRRFRKELSALAAGIIALAAIGGAATWRSRSHSNAPDLQTITLMPFESSPGNLATRAIASSMADQVNAELPIERALVRAEGAHLNGSVARISSSDWVVRGQVIAATPRPIVRASIETGAGAMIWSRDIDPVKISMAEAAAVMATRVASVTTCALAGRRTRRSPETLELLFDACDATDMGSAAFEDEGALIALRRFAERAPDDPLAHALFGTGLAIIANGLPDSMARAARSEADRELTRAASLDPRQGEIFLGRYALLPSGAPLIRAEALLARGLAVEPDNPQLVNTMADFLANVGRNDEAAVMALRAHSLDPAHVIHVVSAADALAQAGRPRAALDLLDEALSRLPHNDVLVQTRFSILLRNGDPAGARKLLDRAATIPGFTEPDRQAVLRRETYAIQFPEGAEASVMAHELITGVTNHSEPPDRAVLALASIGRVGAALDIAEHHQLEEPVLFRPSSRQMLLSPRFPRIAKRQGLWEYWLASGHWPDICRDPARQWRCG